MYLLIIARLSSHHSIPRGSISVLSRAKKWVPIWTDLRRSFWVSLTVGSSLYQWSCGLEQIYELAAFFISVFFQYFGKRKSMPETFLCSTKEVSAHNLGCPVVSRVTFFWGFFVDRLQSVRHFGWRHRHMRNSNHAPRGFRISLSIVKPISKDYVVVFIIVYGY